MIRVVELKQPRYCLVFGGYPGIITDIYKDEEAHRNTEWAVTYYDQNGVNYCNYALPTDIVTKSNKRQFDKRYKMLSIGWAVKFIKECNEEKF